MAFVKIKDNNGKWQTAASNDAAAITTKVIRTSVIPGSSIENTTKETLSVNELLQEHESRIKKTERNIAWLALHGGGGSGGGNGSSGSKVALEYSIVYGNTELKVNKENKVTVDTGTGTQEVNGVYTLQLDEYVNELRIMFTNQIGFGRKYWNINISYGNVTLGSILYLHGSSANTITIKNTDIIKSLINNTGSLTISGSYSDEDNYVFGNTTFNCNLLDTSIILDTSDTTLTLDDNYEPKESSILYYSYTCGIVGTGVEYDINFSVLNEYEQKINEVNKTVTIETNNKQNESIDILSELLSNVDKEQRLGLFIVNITIKHKLNTNIYKTNRVNITLLTKNPIVTTNSLSSLKENTKIYNIDDPFEIIWSVKTSSSTTRCKYVFYISGPGLNNYVALTTPTGEYASNNMLNSTYLNLKNAELDIEDIIKKHIVRPNGNDQLIPNDDNYYKISITVNVDGYTNTIEKNTYYICFRESTKAWISLINAVEANKVIDYSPYLGETTNLFNKPIEVNYTQYSNPIYNQLPPENIISVEKTISDNNINKFFETDLISIKHRMTVFNFSGVKIIDSDNGIQNTPRSIKFSNGMFAVINKITAIKKSDNTEINSISTINSFRKGNGFGYDLANISATQGTNHVGDFTISILFKSETSFIDNQVILWWGENLNSDKSIDSDKLPFGDGIAITNHDIIVNNASVAKLTDDVINHVIITVEPVPITIGSDNKKNKLKIYLNGDLTYATVPDFPKDDYFWGANFNEFWLGGIYYSDTTGIFGKHTCDFNLYSFKCYNRKFSLIEVASDFINSKIIGTMKGGTQDFSIIDEELQKNFAQVDPNSRLLSSALIDSASGKFTAQNLIKTTDGEKTLNIDIINQLGANIKIPIMFINIAQDATAKNWTFDNFKVNGDSSIIKGTSANCSISYIDLKNSKDTVINITDASCELQGTSTLKDTIKNININVNGGTTHDITKENIFIPKATWFPEKIYTLKADVVDSSHAANTSLGLFINECLGENLTTGNTSWFKLPDTARDAVTTGTYYMTQKSEFKPTLKHTVEGFPVFLLVRFFQPDGSVEDPVTPLGIFNLNLGRDAYRNLGFKKVEKILDSNNNQVIVDKIPYFASNCTVTETDMSYPGVNPSDVERRPHWIEVGGTNNMSKKTWEIIQGLDGTSDSIARLSSSEFNTSEGAFWQNDVGIISQIFEVKYPLSKGIKSFANSFVPFVEQITKIPFENCYRCGLNEGGEAVFKSFDITNKYTKWKLNAVTNVKEIDKETPYIIPYTTAQEFGENKEESLLFNDESFLKYFTICCMFGLIDNLTKNMTFRSWPLKRGDEVSIGKYYAGFYDMDSSLGGSNQGSLNNNDVPYTFWLKWFRNNNETGRLEEYYKVNEAGDGAGVFGGYYSKLWLSLDSGTFRKIYNNWSESISGSTYAITWQDLRGFLQNKMNNDINNVSDDTWTLFNKKPNNIAEWFMWKYFIPQVDSCGSILFNIDYETKYFIEREFDNTWTVDMNSMHKLHGRSIGYRTNWLSKRIQFFDTYFNARQTSVNVKGLTFSYNGNNSSDNQSSPIKSDAIAIADFTVGNIPQKNKIVNGENQLTSYFPCTFNADLIVHGIFGDNTNNAFYLVNENKPNELWCSGAVSGSQIRCTLTSAPQMLEFGSLKNDINLSNFAISTINSNVPFKNNKPQSLTSFGFGSLEIIDISQDSRRQTSLTKQFETLFTNNNTNIFANILYGYSELKQFKAVNFNVPKLSLDINFATTYENTGKYIFKKLNSIDISGSTSIAKLSLPNVPILNFNIKNSGIETYNLDNQNFIKTIDLSGCKNVKIININACNGIKEIKIEDNVNGGLYNSLTTINISSNSELVSVSVKNCKVLNEIKINDNPKLTSVTINSCPSLVGISNDVEKCVITNNTMLSNVVITNNLKLQYINLLNNGGNNTDTPNTLTTLTLNDNLVLNTIISNSNFASEYLDDNDISIKQKIDLTYFNNPNLNIYFYNCQAAEYIYCRNTQNNPVNITKNSVFYNCRKLKRIFGNYKITSFNRTFYNCLQFSIHGNYMYSLIPESWCGYSAAQICDFNDNEVKYIKTPWELINDTGTLNSGNPISYSATQANRVNSLYKFNSNKKSTNIIFNCSNNIDFSATFYQNALTQFDIYYIFYVLAINANTTHKNDSFRVSFSTAFYNLYSYVGTFINDKSNEYTLSNSCRFIVKDTKTYTDTTISSVKSHKPNIKISKYWFNMCWFINKLNTDPWLSQRSLISGYTVPERKLFDPLVNLTDLDMGGFTRLVIPNDYFNNNSISKITSLMRFYPYYVYKDNNINYYTLINEPNNYLDKLGDFGYSGNTGVDGFFTRFTSLKYIKNSFQSLKYLRLSTLRLPNKLANIASSFYVNIMTDTLDLIKIISMPSNLEEISNSFVNKNGYTEADNKTELDSFKSKNNTDDAVLYISNNTFTGFSKLKSIGYPITHINNVTTGQANKESWSAIWGSSDYYQNNTYNNYYSFRNIKKVIIGEVDNNKYNFPYNIFISTPVLQYCQSFFKESELDTQYNWNSIELPGTLFEKTSELKNIHDIFADVNFKYMLTSNGFRNCKQLSVVAGAFRQPYKLNNENGPSGMIPYHLFFHGKNINKTNVNLTLKGFNNILDVITNDEKNILDSNRNEINIIVDLKHNTSTIPTEYAKDPLTGDFLKDENGDYIMQPKYTQERWGEIVEKYNNAKVVSTKIVNYINTHPVVYKDFKDNNNICDINNCFYGCTNLTAYNNEEFISSISNIENSLLPEVYTSNEKTYPVNNYDNLLNYVTFNPKYNIFRYTWNSNNLKSIENSINSNKYNISWLYDGLNKCTDSNTYTWEDNYKISTIENSKNISDNKSITLNFLHAPDLLKYCSSKVIVNSLFENCGFVWKNTNDSSLASVGSTDANAVYSNQKLFNGRMVPWMLYPAYNTTEIKSLFKNCSNITNYYQKSITDTNDENKGSIYQIPIDFFKNSFEYDSTNNNGLLAVNNLTMCFYGNSFANDCNFSAFTKLQNSLILDLTFGFCEFMSSNVTGLFTSNYIVSACGLFDKYSHTGVSIVNNIKQLTPSLSYYSCSTRTTPNFIDNFPNTNKYSLSLNASLGIFAGRAFNNVREANFPSWTQTSGIFSTYVGKSFVQSR